MRTDPISQAATAATQQAPPAPAAPPAPTINRDIQEQALAAVREGMQAARAGQDAAIAAAQAGQAAKAGQAVNGAGGIRIVKDGKVVTIGPQGVEVTTTTQPAIAPPIPVIPREAVVISIAFFVMVVLVVVGWPIARAIARRMDRSAAAPPRLPAEHTEQLRRIEQAVEAMAIEVERVSENQRFVTKLLSEARPDGALLAQGEAASRALSSSAEPPRGR